MVLERVLKHSKTLIEKVTETGDITIDCTVGNGYDTLFLSKLVGKKGFVYGFDIQEQAIEHTRQNLKENNCYNVSLHQIGHEHLLEVIKPEHFKQIASAIFNLGYLPTGDRSITTTSTSTIKAIESLLQIMKVNGLIVIVVYTGHEEGAKEMEELMHYMSSLDQKQAQVLMYRFLNQSSHAPFIIAIEKMKN
jgi:tRNA A58 N-methylase Trm61